MMQKIEDNEKHLSTDTWKHQLPYPKALCRKKKNQERVLYEKQLLNREDITPPSSAPTPWRALTHWHSHKAGDGGREMGGYFSNLLVALTIV